MFAAAAFRTVVDALDDRDLSPKDFLDRDHEEYALWLSARARIERRDPDFMMCCDCGGIDGELLRETVMDGRMTIDLAYRALNRFLT